MTNAPDLTHEPNPGLIFDAFNAYQRSAALKAAIELDVFTQIAQGHRDADSLSKAVRASARGIRILCDFLTIHGFLSKEAGQYALSVNSAMFLDRNSPAYMGSAADFLLDPRLISPFLNLAQVVRDGRTTMPEEGTVSHDNPIWVDFAKQMAPMVFPAAVEIAELVATQGATHVLDIAAGHGLFGIWIGKQNPQARITALDWPAVLEVAKANAVRFGVGERYSTLPGDAFEVEFGGPYDVVLVTNFFHHYDRETCETLMRKIAAALAPGGRCVTLDFVPNDDRVSPSAAAAFAMIMLGTTVAGDAYTFAEYDAMFRKAGFGPSELHQLAKAQQSVIMSRKNL